jgi:beta-carotene ketolase (CrtO type)
MRRDLRRRADDDHDAVVIGGGHNGLVTAAYLARAGLDVHVVEARQQVGGTAASETFAGASVNICNCDHIAFRTTPVADDLALGDHGLEYLDVDPCLHATLWGSDRLWTQRHSVEATLDSIAAVSPSQVAGYRRYVAAARPVVEAILCAALEPPTIRSLTRLVAARRLRGITALLRWSRMSAEQVLRQFFDDDLVIAPALAAGPVVWGVGPRQRGGGLGALALTMRHVGKVGRPRGGSGALTESLAAAVRANGGTVGLGVAARSVDCEGEGVRAVTLADGRQLRAPIVVSSCDPRRTLVEWLTTPPASAERAIARWRGVVGADGYESKIDAVLDGPPTITALGETSGATLALTPTSDDLDRGARLLTAGRVLERPVLLLNTPSVLDAMLAPAGRHVFSLECLFTPYTFSPGWSDGAEPRRWLDLAATAYDGDFLSSVLDWRVMTPDTYEREFHLPAGHAHSFVGGPLAALRNEHPELTRYETSVTGLYLTGAATFPGAGIWGASGRNCATVILNSL